MSKKQDWSIFKNFIDFSILGLSITVLETRCFTHLLRLMSREDRKDKKKLGFFVNLREFEGYEKYLDTRSTCCGDKERVFTITPFGVELFTIGSMPDDKIVLTFRKNVVYTRSVDTMNTDLEFMFKNPDLVYVGSNFGG